MFAMIFCATFFSEGACVAFDPYLVSTRFTRNIFPKSKICPDEDVQPCLTYLTFGENASNSVYVIFHTPHLEENSKLLVYVDVVSHSSPTGYANQYIPSFSLFESRDLDRYICWERLDNLIPKTTYYYRTGWIDGNGTPFFTSERKFKTLPSQVLPNEVCIVGFWFCVENMVRGLCVLFD
jgi:hypothetical protein